MLEGEVATLGRRESFDPLTELGSEPGQVGDAAILGVNPRNELVIWAMRVNLAHRKLCLAHAAEPCNRLGYHRSVRDAERLLERGELALPAREGGGERGHVDPHRCAVGVAWNGRWPHSDPPQDDVLEVAS